MLAGYLHPCHPVALWHRVGSLGTWMQWWFLHSWAWLLHPTALHSWGRTGAPGLSRATLAPFCSQNAPNAAVWVQCARLQGGVAGASGM